MKKVMAVASIGGHWIQLLRIARPVSNVKYAFYRSDNIDEQIKKRYF